MFKSVTTVSSLHAALPRQAFPGRGFTHLKGLHTSPRRRISCGAVPWNSKAVVAAAVGSFGGLIVYQLATRAEVHAEAPPRIPSNELRRKLSVQHIQVENSWEHPGVYAWGNNIGRVVAPDLSENLVKSPRRIPFFKNMLLRDLKLDHQTGAAVTENGDLLQWGTGYAEGTREPQVTLKGKNIIQVDLSQDRVFALSKNGTIYSIPVSKKYQETGPKPAEFSWIPGLGSESNIHYRILKPALGHFESVIEMAAGRDHILLLTSRGRVFSAAASSTFPAKGQMGIQGLTYATRPKGKPYDTCHEITALVSSKVKQIAAGDYHSLARDDQGRVFSFGDNTNGQLGFDYDPETNFVSTPTLLTFTTQYPSNKTTPTVTNIAAGGANSYLAVDVGDAENGTVTSDLLACGTGIFGNLGNGRWTHVQGPPVKVKQLSGLSEYDEKAKKLIPIRPKHLSVGATHTSAIMNNLTNVNASTAANSSVHDVNYGADALWWGNNEHYQLGTGKRSNSCVPVYIPPLDPVPRGVATNNPNSDTSTGKSQTHRFQITPKKEVTVDGRRVKVEQKITCGRGNTAVYSAV